MSTTVQFACQITTSTPTVPLGLEIWLDDQQIFNSEHVQTTVDFSHSFDDNDAEHELKFRLKNKLPEHTVVSADGAILSDALLEINNITMEDIAIDQIVNDHAVYTHNFNGTQPLVQDQFFGSMGCNGDVVLKFHTPVYLWLLEHM